ncbi:S9 family peptidase [Jeotgalibaca ciconiae]|uniref:S9 family peptidase n=1 Tax=Jeotgalibaca ciconiae TaxID=2496265 RepID=A0A3Q9BJN4_9LACT|nr:S9 family peptidase [Jeotgalibaca ciconiae]AZP03925.1 S9 family peptidase [Jeotgalibaca ciconiae]
MSKEKLSMESLFDLKSLSQPVAWGDLIFYIETTPNKEENSYHSTIYSIDRVTKERRKWGDGGTRQVGLKVSPNKKYLSYLSNNNKEKKMQVMLMPLDGGSAFALTDEKEGVSNYLWMNNSASIYYQTTELNEKEDDKVPAEKKLPTPTEINKLTYKLDGMGILPQDRTYFIKKISVATEDVQTIMKEEHPIRLSYVSNDERYLLFGDDLDPEDEWSYGSTIYYYDLSSKEKRSLTTSIPKGSFYFGSMSDKEDYLLLLGNGFEHAFVSLNKVYGYDMKDHKLTCLTDELDIEVSDTIVADFQQGASGIPLTWLNEDEFLFSATYHGKIQLYKGNRQGETQILFDRQMHLTDGYYVEGTSEFITTFSTLTITSELGVINLETAELEIIYQPNKKYFETHEVIEPERFWYKGADQWDIQGWYLPPVEKRPNHPAVLYVHGGPQVCYGESFFHEMQVLAADGYGVIMLNPRGGNGYGQEFVASILGDYGNKDYEDLMLGTTHVLNEHPEIDASHLYVAGGSYGGFMTNWIVGHTDRFRAAISQRSISNWISFYGTSDIGAFFVEFQLQRDLSDMEGLWKMSPLAYAKNAKIPILMMHSDQDLRCPMEQAEQFYVAMKKNDVDTKLITFPQSNHGLSRNGLPNLRMKRFDAMMDWLKKYQ